MLILVRAKGVEPPRPCGHKVLNLACMPFHHARSSFIILEIEPKNIYNTNLWIKHRDTQVKENRTERLS